MDVYLVPVGRERYELYCEVPDEPEPPADEAASGFVHRMKVRFAAMLVEAERERRRTHAAGLPKASPSSGFSGICVVRRRRASIIRRTSKSGTPGRCCGVSSGVISNGTGCG